MRVKSRRRQLVSIDQKKLTSYAVASAAAFVGAGTANAEIIHVVLNNVVEDTAVGGGGMGVNMTFTPTGGGANWNFALGHDLGTANAANGVAFSGDLFNRGNAAQFAGFVAGAYSYVTKLAANTPINALTFLPNTALGTLAANGGYTNSQFLAAGTGFIGIKFNTNQFGWIRVTMNGAPLNSFTIVDYAYASTGESIVAGQITAVPEPGSLGLLAAGSVGIVLWRRRRAASLTTAA